MYNLQVKIGIKNPWDPLTPSSPINDAPAAER